VENIWSNFYPQICVFWKNIAEQLLVACIRYAGTYRKAEMKNVILRFEPLVREM
jgi:hypothetical protein